MDYAQLVKTYGAEVTGEARYSPPQIVSAIPVPISGNPDVALISTSYVERQNLTMRMQIRRFTRLTNAFSKKLYNLRNALALHFAHYAKSLCVHEAIDQEPALNAAIFVQDKHSHVFDVVIQRVTERDHLDQWRKEKKEKRQRITRDDDEFLEQDCA